MNKPVEYINSTFNSVTDTLDKNMDWLNNKMITNIVVFGLVIYATFFVGKIWPKGMDFFKHPLVKLVLFILVAYMATKNIALGLMATIVIVIIMMTNLKNTKEFMTVIPQDYVTTDDDVYESIMGRCICRCNGTKCACECKNEDPEELDINQIMTQEELLLPQEEMQEKNNDMNSYQELNRSAWENVKNQFRQHEIEVNKERTMCGRDRTPYYDNNISFRSGFLN